MSLPPFQRLLDDNADDVYGFLVASVGRQEADDAYQETVLAALRSYPDLRRADNLRGWLFTIAHHKAMDVHRGRRRRPTPVEDVPAVAAAAPAEPRDEALWGAVGALPPKQRGAVLLRFVADLSHRQIASALETSEPAARRNLHEGLRKLEEAITR
jgi:RNA polymerase sigma factor (sigma-70 family)